MRRLASVGMALTLAATLGACDLDIFGDSCLSLDGPCSDGGGRGQGQSVYAVGFPSARVDRSNTTPNGGYVGRVRVGDTFPLHLVFSPALGSPTPTDTIRVVTWESSDASVATVTSGTSGSGIFVARAAGTVQVSGNGLNDLWACETNGCARVDRIEITP